MKSSSKVSETNGGAAKPGAVLLTERSQITEQTDGDDVPDADRLTQATIDAGLYRLIACLSLLVPAAQTLIACRRSRVVHFAREFPLIPESHYDHERVTSFLRSRFPQSLSLGTIVRSARSLAVIPVRG